MDSIPDVSGLVTTSALDAKTGEIENKIPDHNNYVLLLLNLIDWLA